MKKNKILAMILAVTLTITPLASCGDSGNANEDVIVKSTVDGNDAEKALAKELLERNPTTDDVITEGVVNEYIKLLKEKYTFEEIDKIYLKKDEDVYTAFGKGWYDELFGDSGISVEIQESVDDNEPSLMERGELHFANRMLYPYLLDKEKGADIVAVWESDNPPKDIVSIIVRSDSEYTSFADLKGGKIASSSAGCPYSVLMELADNQGWKEGVDYEHVSTKEYVNALLAGEVDAICYHPDKSCNSILLSGEGKIIDTALDGGVYVSGGGDRVIFCPTQFVKDYPNIVHGYVDLMKVVGPYVVNNPDDCAETVERIDRTPQDSTKWWLSSATGTYYTNPGSVDDLKDNAKRFIEFLVKVDENFEAVPDVDSGYFAEEFFTN